MKIKYLYQQLFSHLSVIIIAFVILSLLFSQFVEQFVYNNKIEELTTYGHNILNDMETTTRGSQAVLSEYSTVLVGRGIQFSLFDEESKIIYAKQGNGPDVTVRDEEWNKIINGETVVVRQDFKRFGEGVTFVLLPYFHNGNFIGGILLASPIQGLSAAISQINNYLFYTVVIALAVSLLLGWFLSAFHVNRIKRIQAATSKVAGGDYAVKIPSSNFDEIGELARDFNYMVEKLNLSMEEIQILEDRRRKFMADVSHELRTPLTTISGVIEGIRNDMIPESEKARGMQLASKETKRLIRLVNENLDYEKIRSNQVTLNQAEIQLKEVFEIIKDQLAMLADEKHNEIRLDVTDDITIYADYDRLTQILINIIKNSIQFTENGIIHLRGYSTDNKTIIEIEDTGTGINPVDIEKIWRRFYKAGLSRSTNPYGEFGLGLAIVKQLVVLHQGEINVMSETNQGTTFTLTFPKG